MGTRENKALVRRYWKAYETGDVEAVVAFLHSRHVFHPEGGRRVEGLRARTREDAVFLRGFPRVRVVVEDQVAEGDRVASRITMIATQSGRYQGRAPTGKRIRIPFLDIARIRDGKIVEEWTEFDWASLLRRLRGSRTHRVRASP